MYLTNCLLGCTLRSSSSQLVLTGVTSLSCLSVNVDSAIVCWVSKFVTLAAFMLKFAVQYLTLSLIEIITCFNLSVLENTRVVVILPDPVKHPDQSWLSIQFQGIESLVCFLILNFMS